MRGLTRDEADRNADPQPIRLGSLENGLASGRRGSGPRRAVIALMKASLAFVSVLGAIALAACGGARRPPRRLSSRHRPSPRRFARPDAAEASRRRRLALDIHVTMEGRLKVQSALKSYDGPLPGLANIGSVSLAPSDDHVVSRDLRVGRRRHRNVRGHLEDPRRSAPPRDDRVEAPGSTRQDHRRTGDQGRHSRSQRRHDRPGAGPRRRRLDGRLVCRDARREPAGEDRWRDARRRRVRRRRRSRSTSRTREVPSGATSTGSCERRT
jgi:hypothetical protein